MFTIPYDNTLCLQQVVSGVGTFSGVSVGYDRYEYNAGGAQFSVRARDLGAASGFRLALLDAGPGQVVRTTVVRWDDLLKTCFVTLRRTAGAITALASEVVVAINTSLRNTGAQYDDYGNQTQPSASYGGSMPVVAGLKVDAVIGAALASTALSGGVDPTQTVPGGPVRLDLPSGASGGMFYFDQRVPWRVSSVCAKFAGNVVTSLRVVNVDAALNAVSGEEVEVWSATPTNLYFSREDMTTIVMPGQALQVVAATQGLVRVTARPEAVRSYQ